MSTPKYNPIVGSVAYKVIEFFTTNPEEILTTLDLEAKFEKPATQFHSLLAAAIESGALKRTKNEDDELVYSIGKGHPSIKTNTVRHPTARPDVLLSGGQLGERKKPVVVDLEKLTLRDDVPLPDPGKKKLDWTVLFKRMAVGQSAVLPIAVRAALNKACTKAKVDGLGEFALRVDSDETVAVWRTA